MSRIPVEQRSQRHGFMHCSSSPFRAASRASRRIYALPTRTYSSLVPRQIELHGIRSSSLFIACWSLYLLPMTGRIAWWIWVGMSINLQNRLPLKMTRCIVLE